MLYTRWEEDIKWECPGLELNGQFLEVEEKFRYFADTLGTEGGAKNFKVERIF